MSKTEMSVPATDLRIDDVLVDRAGYTVASVRHLTIGGVQVWTLGGVRLDFAATDFVRVLR